ncbi:MAG: ribosome biogenesis GTPase Der [Proteobacteria bacterium]|nr:ribosome biogenesis GTPase Der [Pseudomonadota bacterium]
MLPTLAIIGRPNVGKSTLFNRLIGRRRALVADEPGLTRDRHYATASFDDRELLLVDTGGFEDQGTSGIESAVRLQTQIAIDEADLVLLVTDARAGLTSTDQELIARLRRAAKPTLHVANKVDGPQLEAAAAELYRFGVTDVHAVSAEHGRGLDELVTAIVARLPPPPARPVGEAVDAGEAGEAGAQRVIRLALVGRPNAGKSALLNRLAGSERAIVCDEPGTTRDPVDVELETSAGRFVVVDTAGIRRKRRVAPAMEQIAVLRAQRCIHEADVACLLIDASEELSAQDVKIANLVLEAGRGLVLVFSKSDLVGNPQQERRRLARLVSDQLRFAESAPQLLLSAQTGAGVARLLPAVRAVDAACAQRVGTGELNRLLAELVEQHHPPAHQGRPIKLFYATQATVRPPTFIVTASLPQAVPESYRRYLVNRLRERYGFAGAPLRIFVRGRRRDSGA